MRSGGARRQSALSPRAAEILCAIVQEYVDTGEPVASRTISKYSHTNLSAASIRNIMADLSDAGYLSQPHTSAGRIPTALAFREFVQLLQVGRGGTMETSRLRHEIGSVETLDAKVERVSHVLMQVSRSMGIAAAIPTEAQTLQQVELIGLSDRRVLMVVVTSDRMVRDKIVTVERDLSQDELATLRNFINMHFAGWTFAAIRKDLEGRLEEDRAMYDRMLQRVNMLVEQGMLQISQTPTLHTDGASNLVGVDLHLTREKMRELFQTLEEKRRVLQLLNRFLEANGEVGVQVGLGEVHPSMDELSLIGLTVELPSGVSAKIAVLGPMRMNYERVMTAVYHVGRALQGTVV